LLNSIFWGTVITAQILMAETSADIGRSLTAGHLCAWAGRYGPNQVGYEPAAIGTGGSARALRGCGAPSSRRPGDSAGPAKTVTTGPKRPVSPLPTPRFDTRLWRRFSAGAPFQNPVPTRSPSPSGSLPSSPRRSHQGPR
jgi:hypothetical protein